MINCYLSYISKCLVPPLRKTWNRPLRSTFQFSTSKAPRWRHKLSFVTQTSCSINPPNSVNFLLILPGRTRLLPWRPTFHEHDRHVINVCLVCYVDQEASLSFVNKPS